MRLRWVISGGGTGGHVTPALALGEAIRESGDPVLFVGSRRGLEGRLVPEAGFELETLDARPLIGRSPLERARNLIALVGATVRARQLLRRFRADRVISVGGYASAPAALAAVWCRIPMVLVNTDVAPGAANRLLARFARRIFVGFEAAQDRFGSLRARVVHAGVPLRRALRDAFAGNRDEDRSTAGTSAPRLFVFGGSQGARQINEAMMAALPGLHTAWPALEVVHQTGEEDHARVAAAYAAAGVRAEVVAFETDMPARYRAADLVVCRAGAISIAELTLAGRPALVVPLAHVGGGEQFDNARVLEEVGAARMLDPRELTDERFAAALHALLGDPKALVKMGAAAASLARPRAAEDIIAACRELEGGSR